MFLGLSTPNKEFQIFTINSNEVGLSFMYSSKRSNNTPPLKFACYVMKALRASSIVIVFLAKYK